MTIFKPCKLSFKLLKNRRAKIALKKTAPMDKSQTGISQHALQILHGKLCAEVSDKILPIHISQPTTDIRGISD